MERLSRYAVKPGSSTTSLSPPWALAVEGLGLECASMTCERPHPQAPPQLPALKLKP